MPIPGFNAAATKLRSLGTPTLVVGQLTLFPDEEFREVCQAVLTPQVNTVVVHLNAKPKAGSASLCDYDKDALSVVDLNTKIAAIRACRPDVIILGAGWLAAQAEQLNAWYPLVDAFYIHGYDVVAAVADVNAGSVLETYPNKVLVNRYIDQAPLRGRFPVLYDPAGFQGSAGYAMMLGERCLVDCNRCAWEPGCKPEALLTWANSRERLLAEFRSELIDNVQRCHIKDWVLVDYNFSADRRRAQDVRAIQQELGVPLTFFTDCHVSNLQRDLGIVEEMVRAGVRGFNLRLYSLRPENHRLLGTGVSYPVKTLESIRAVAGPDVFIHATLVAGLPADTYASVLADAAWLLTAEGQRLLDSFSFIEPHFGHKTPIGRSGRYIYPEVGRITPIGTAYWETEGMTSVEARAAVLEVQRLCQSKKWGYVAWPITASNLNEMLSSANLGFPMARSFELFRQSAEDASAHQVLAKELASLEADYMRRYIQRLCSVRPS